MIRFTITFGIDIFVTSHFFFFLGRVFLVFTICDFFLLVIIDASDRHVKPAAMTEHGVFIVTYTPTPI